MQLFILLQSTTTSVETQPHLTATTTTKAQTMHTCSEISEQSTAKH